MNASLRRDVLRVLAGDCSAGSNGEKGKARDVRLQLWLNADLELADEVIMDIRRLNGSESHYDQFLEIMAQFLEEYDMKVNARRHGSVCETPIAWRIKSLKEDIIKYAASHSTFLQTTGTK